MNALPDISLALLERVYPRTFACLEEKERIRLARELCKSSLAEDLTRFPAFLQERRWDPARGFVPDLAWLEYYLRLVSMAPEIETRGFERVPMAGEPDWYEAKIRFDPGHRLLESEWPLETVFALPDAPQERRPGTYLIYRTAGKSQFRRLGANEEALIRALSLGVTLGKVLERPNGPDFDARIFHRWMETGFLRAIDWAPV